MPLSPQQNLDRLQKIVNENGVPTEFFIRFIQERGGAVTDLDALVTELEALVATFEADITALQNDKADKSIVLTAGNGLTGGGDLSASRTFTIGTVDPTRIVVNANDIDLAPTAVTPGSYTSTDLTVDQYGRITAAANGSGGGGGGGGGGVNVYTNSSSVSGATGTTPTSMTAVISVNIPSSTSPRTFLVSGNIVWRDGVHPMRGGVLLDTTQVWPNTGVANAGIDPVSSTDGMDNLNFSGVIVTVPGDGAAHTISLGWVSASSTGSLTLENRQITCVEITSGAGRTSNIVAKARIEWASTGVATIIGGVNVASITRTAAGQFTVTFTNAIPAGCTSLAHGRFGTIAANNQLLIGVNQNSGKGVTTTTFDFICQLANSGTTFDPYDGATSGSWMYFEIIDPTATMISSSGSSGGGLFDISMGVPAISALTQIGPTYSTYTENAGKGLNVKNTTTVGANSTLLGFTKAKPSTNFHCAILMLPQLNRNNYWRACAGVFNSANGRFETISACTEPAQPGTFELGTWSAYNARTGFSTANGPYAYGPFWMHVKYDGTNLLLGYSIDGANPYWVFTRSLATYISAITDVFFGMFAYAGDTLNGQNVTILCYDENGNARVMGV